MHASMSTLLLCLGLVVNGSMAYLTIGNKCYHSGTVQCESTERGQTNQPIVCNTNHIWIAQSGRCPDHTVCTVDSEKNYVSCNPRDKVAGADQMDGAEGDQVNENTDEGIEEATA
ncbi:uncharacterized protein GGS25DRAFT_500153 [Hypoxylon fragiforme]|uniref:uncharacterized protein n=1 Tax=Hypoxylon fragiforme TaxID=63214 RepID=UPI0020C71DDD|nr:uncharacterized protein GGS25DRAFT_500153 [Hypoxylon fragiforme]KAI2606215.1 hypothetical protein GGS25DRAFT_500153 [Hypoxylon fragiforme]